MTTRIMRYAGTKGTLLILMVGLVSALLIVAACGGTSKAATAEPTAESGPTSADPDPSMQLFPQVNPDRHRKPPKPSLREFPHPVSCSQSSELRLQHQNPPLPRHRSVAALPIPAYNIAPASRSASG